MKIFVTRWFMARNPYILILFYFYWQMLVASKLLTWEGEMLVYEDRIWDLRLKSPSTPLSSPTSPIA